MKVSVVIPCYNVEEYVGKAIESVFNQTFKDYEIIVVDDASTDKSSEIVEQMNARYDVRYVRNEENLGIGGARTRGVKEAKGEYLCFLSADDLFTPNYLENMMMHADKKSFLFSDYFIVNESGATMSQFNAPRFENYNDFVLHCVLQAKTGRMFVCYNLFGPTKLFRKNNFDENLRYGEDLDHLLRCLLVKKVRFKHIPLPLFKYRISPKMVTQQKKQLIPYNNQQIFQKINGMLKRKVF